MRTLIRSLIAIVALTAVFGFAYPALLAGIGALAFHSQAQGSLLTRNGTVVGSALAAQSFTSPRYFHERPSGTTPAYNAASTTFSNLGPTNPALAKEIRQQAQAILKLEGPYNPGLTIADIPVDAVTPSGSGIDPDISPAYAQLQARRVAARAGPAAGHGREAHQREHHRAQPRLSGRARRQRARAQPCARQARRQVRWLPSAPASSRASWLLAAIRDSFPKLDPRHQVRNPVMFIVELGSLITSGIFVIDLARGQTGQLWFVAVITVWLWLTVLFANFAEAIAEGRGKAQANALRATRTATIAHRRRESGALEEVQAPDLQRGDVVVIEAGEIIPADGDVIEGIGSVDESAITGESAPVIREAGGDRSAVTGGTKLLSDRLVVSVTQEPGKSFLDRMIALVEGAARRKTPNEIALNILLAGLTLTFLAAVVTLRPFALFAKTSPSQTVLIALLVALIPTTIGALLSAIGIAGMDRLVQRNVLAMSGRAVEASGDVDVLLLDKTGTITLGNRQAADFIPAPGIEERELAEAAQLASLADETPEGRSIVVLAKERFNVRERDLSGTEFVPFSAVTRMSGVNIDGTMIRKGAAEAVRQVHRRARRSVPGGGR